MCYLLSVTAGQWTTVEPDCTLSCVHHSGTADVSAIACLERQLNEIENISLPEDERCKMVTTEVDVPVCLPHLHASISGTTRTCLYIAFYNIEFETVQRHKWM
jgi:hypothetical protein